MKKGISKSGLIVMFSLFTLTSLAGLEDWALKATIQPEYPTINNPISILSSGISGAGGVTVKNTFFQINGTDLSLDLYIKIGRLTVVTPWSYTENIGTLPAGTYDLAVIAYYDYWGFSISEKYFTSFQVVVPEPSSVALLALGGLLLRRKREGDF